MRSMKLRGCAVVIAQHGYKADRGEMLNEAEILHRHGYGVLVTSIRAHDLSEGTLITFGHEEIKDLETQLGALESKIHDFLARLPNLPDEDVKAGGKEHNEIVRAVTTDVTIALNAVVPPLTVVGPS